MNLEETFYIVGIVYMSLYTIFLLVIIVMLFYIKKRVNEVATELNEKISVVSSIVNNPQEIAYEIGSRIVKKAFNKVSKITKEINKEK